MEDAEKIACLESLVDPAKASRKNCELHTTETKCSFQTPKLKKPTTTRAMCLEKFLWHEVYEEYLRIKAREAEEAKPDNKSEYMANFHKEMTHRSATARQELINKYPLYVTDAVTLWNRTGDSAEKFKKRYSITKPVWLNDKQFG